MNQITRIATDRRGSRAVVHNGIVFLSGVTADDRGQDIRGQTQQVLAKIDRFLSMAGTSKSRLLTAQIWMKDIKNDFAGMNEVWDAWTAVDAAPTRAAAQCDLGLPEILVEIIVTAAIENTGSQ